MRKFITVTTTMLLMTATLIFNACKKEGREASSLTEFNQQNIVTKVNDWLEKRKDGYNAIGKANVDLLKN